MRLLLLSSADMFIRKEMLVKSGTIQIDNARNVHDIHFKEELYDIIMTFDLYQFNKTTLTDNISYNLLPCKQIHIITKDNLPNEKYLEKQLSISMFFYCMDSKYYHYLLEKYPDIPYLKEVKGWKSSDDEKSAETNANILSEIIEEVMQICHMA